jgi:hypothetical protein
MVFGSIVNPSLQFVDFLLTCVIIKVIGVFYLIEFSTDIGWHELKERPHIH